MPDHTRLVACCVGDVSSRVGSSTFGLFALLATGLVARPVRRTVVGMLAASGMAAVVSFHAVCRFFSTHAWDADRLGLALARLIVTRLLDHDAPIEVVVDDTLFRRWGPRVFGSFWTHDGSAQDPNALGRGNRWVVAGIIVELPFCIGVSADPVPALARQGHPVAGAAGRAADHVAGKEFPEYTIHPVGDAAYHGEALLTEGTTFTTAAGQRRAVRPTAAAHRQTRPPPLKGHRLGTPAVAATAGWRVPVTRYGRRDTVEVAEIRALWYGAFGNQPGRVVLVHDPGDPKILAIFTTDLDGAIEHVVSRYAHRWPIETAIAAGKLYSASARPATGCSARSNAPCPSSSSSTASSSSGTRCTATIPTTSPNAEPPSPGTGTRASQPTKTYSPSSAEPCRSTNYGRFRSSSRPRKYRDYELACAAAAA